MSDLPYRPCVGVMLVNDAGKIFVGERIDSPGAWQMPQGGVDPGEVPQDAALRELWEETGVQASSVTLIAQTDEWLPYDLPSELIGKLWGGKYRGQEQLWFVLRLTAGDEAINIATDHPEFRAWKWSAPEQVIEEIVPFKRDLYREVFAQLGSHVTSLAAS